MGVEVADDEPAAVQEHDGRDHAVHLGAVAPGRDATRQGQRLDRADRRERGGVAQPDRHRPKPARGCPGVPAGIAGAPMLSIIDSSPAICGSSGTCASPGGPSERGSEPEGL